MPIKVKIFPVKGLNELYKMISAHEIDTDQRFRIPVRRLKELLYDKYAHFKRRPQNKIR